MAEKKTAEVVAVETRTSKLKSTSDRVVRFAKERPYHTIACAAVAVLGIYLLWNSYPSKPGTPVTAMGFQPAAVSYGSDRPNPKKQSFGVQGEQTFLVASARKVNDKIFLNNAPDYRAASQTIVVDLKTCPSFAGVVPQALVGKSIYAKGTMGSYNGKPQVEVTDPTNLRILDSLPHASAAK